MAILAVAQIVIRVPLTYVVDPVPFASFGVFWGGVFLLGAIVALVAAYLLKPTAFAAGLGATVLLARPHGADGVVDGNPAFDQIGHDQRRAHQRQ